MDVRKKADVESAFQEVIDKFGYVDVLANIAGIADETKIEDTIYINLVCYRDINERKTHFVQTFLFFL